MICRKRWQIVSDDSVWMFPADIQLSTIKLNPALQYDEPYESCLFFVNGNSEVIARYDTQEEAIKGHEELEKKYNLKRCEKLKLRS